MAQNGICASGLCTSGSPYTIPDNVSISDLELRNGAHVIIPAGITGTTIGNVSLDNSSSLTINKEFPFTGNFSVNSGTVTASAFSGTWNTTPNPDVWDPAPAAGNGKLIFTVGGTLLVASGSTIAMNGRGWAGGAAYTSGSSYTGPGISSGSNNGGGGGAGGSGDGWSADPGAASYGSVAGNNANNGHGYPGAVYGASDFWTELYLGSGGAGGWSNIGGSGGGAIKITAESFINNGSIESKGNDGVGNSAAGSGGTVVIEAATLSGTGSISVAGGSGSGGRVAGSGRMMIKRLDGANAILSMHLDGPTKSMSSLSLTSGHLTFDGTGMVHVVSSSLPSLSNLVALSLAGSGFLAFSHSANFNSTDLTISGSSVFFLNTEKTFKNVTLSNTAQITANAFSGSW